MSKEESDFNSLPDFKIPENFLDQLFEMTGNDDNKGFVLCFVNQNGAPVVYTKTSCQIIEMGCRKALEEYLKGSEDSQIIDYGGEDWA
jgi:hypothetical protein|tara:strand:- start:161 stop:424 length:264 start_codon:yes stop_codon:yes gene_type:complete